ncbi:reverse transcriptase domain-containing protein, partial [Bacillus sp. SRB_331]|uniref:reverse transcriptase domain-containing protein n=1 Tax=Bacillus sp. SRB_331 TaxID=1969379 RepID=UPI00115B5182
MLVQQRNNHTLRATQVTIPKSISEALDSENEFCKEWAAATKAEFDSLQHNKTWELVRLPSGRNAIQNKWVFKVKSDEKGLVNKFKARLVVKGYSQRPGIDFDETFSPVAHLASVRLVFALAASLKLKLRQLDVVGAFLQAELHEEIYMVQPKGYISHDPSLVCRLKKSLYGLKQAGLVWNNTINLFITKDLGFKRLSSDACVYIMRSKE